MPDFSDSTIELWNEFTRAIYDSRFIPGFPGRPDGNGQYTYFATAYPGKLYVRMGGQESTAIQTATNRGQVPLNPNLKIYMTYENGELVIDHADAASLRFLYGNNASTASAVYDAVRTQQGPSLLPPFMVYPNAPPALQVKAAPGWYGDLQRFPNLNTPTLVLVPTATSSKTAWIVLTVDEDTGVLAQTLGADEDAATYTISEITLPDISSIALPAGGMPIAAVLLANGAVSIAQSDIVPLNTYPSGGAGSLVSLTMTGTGGAGYLQARAQSADPSAPGTDGFALFPNASSYLAWRIKNGSDTYTRQFIGVLTAARSFTLPDYDGALATLAGAETFSNKTLDSLTTPKTITPPGTTGDQTINKPSGRVNIAAAGTSVTVTNSLVTANSIILAVAATADATAQVTSVVPGSGSFVIHTAACTAETAFNWLVVN